VEAATVEAAEETQMIEQQEIAVGARVRWRAPSPLVELRADTGRVVRPDEWDGYYIVHLDQPALYHERDGQVRELVEIAEAGDNMDVLPD
jgi:hypothetical protein